MDAIFILIIFALVLGVLLLGASFYFIPRNWQVAKFRSSIIDICYDWNIKYQDINDDSSDSYKWFLNKYSYVRMLYSIKPLRLESWYSADEIKKIKQQ